MRRSALTGILIFALAGLALGQQPAAPPPQKTLAATLDVFAFPEKGQPATQQSKDESDCYNWAVQNTGVDPFQLQKQSQQAAQATQQNKQAAAQSAGQGTVGAEMVKTAVVGTLIGGISGNEGKGAAYGAAAGLIRGSRKQAAQKQQAAQNADAQGQQQQAAIAQQGEKFRKAFSTCLQGKGYKVSY